MPHNFIKIDAYTMVPGDSSDSSKRQRRKESDVKSACHGHSGEFERLLFDADSRPQFAYVQFKDGDVDGVLGQLGGGEKVYRYFAPDEMKPDTP